MNARLSSRPAWQIAVSLGFAATLALTACSSTAETSAPTATAPVGDIDAAAAAALPAKYVEAGVIKVASDYPYPPMEMLDENQNLTGLDFDLAQAIGVKLGVPLTLEKQAFATNIPALQSGQSDIIMSGMNDTAKRQETLDFVDYFYAGFSIMVLAGNPEKITTVLDLCGRDVAVSKATIQAEILRGYDEQCTEAGPGPIKIAELPSETDVQTAVRSGKAIADVVDSAVAAYSAQTAGDGEMFEVVQDPANLNGYNPVYTGIGVLKKDSELTKALVLALDSIIADGTYQTILEKYDLGDYAIDKAGLNLGS
ncbi:ABC transporter substrate-binding protein [Cryobacterium sp. CG_9.6]|uniref:ABC transporter substrate-binding protein n=1 Tax=Cryobacterium sp. CG_9.6 TaxID=2760710 RepID=UPI0024753A8F|nr:ABC transporter substrate-binding protein [Cryobacterium sp. CG_9.6]MDH6236095.1 polar amino acid transport system substrate-binding protein [Cryobacterium sp. CG_9.6]